MSYSESYDPQEGIAIVGMAGRFPGAQDVAQLWKNLVAGRESITHFRPDELEPGQPDEMHARLSPTYVSSRGILDGIERFDAEFFGFNPTEAQILDPQQRIFLETAWLALEDAGYDPAKFGGSIGVFAGSSNNSYYLQNLLARRDVTDLVGWLTTMMGNEKDYLSTRVAYKLDLRGPALNVQTACSTSLVAVCNAVQSLLAYQCDMALAGGVSISLPQRRGYLWYDGAIVSPDGHCRAFDRNARGTVFSNGLGIVTLRRLRDAIADGDTIYAVIKGAALNNDGNSKVSFTAPSVDGHAQVISLAQALAGIDPDTISYVEAHGTGTALGDPVEIAGLTQAFRMGGATGDGYCAIGSLKTNIGHLDAAAGVAGLIKATLALHHKMLPASLHFESPNPRLALESSPFFVNDRLRPWDSGATPRRAGVSSFGVGGTNAHVVLEEAPAVNTAARAAAAPCLLVFSGRSEQVVQKTATRLAEHLEQDAGIAMADVAYTLQHGRRAFTQRRAIVCSGREQVLSQLAQPGVDAVASQPPEVAFLFPGQGSQYAGMGRQLYEREEFYRREIDECAQVLLPHLGFDLRSLLLATGQEDVQAQAKLAQTAVTQPALFVVEYALAQLWQSWGVKAGAMIGHSLGEYVAACLAGVFTRDDALRLVAARGRLMQEMLPGVMFAVRSAPEALQDLLGSRVAIAALNAPTLTVLSTDPQSGETLEKELGARRIEFRKLQTSHAFHSPMMDPVVERFAALVQETPRNTPVAPWISNGSGGLITDGQAIDPAYWAQHLRQPVRFVEGIAQLLDPRFVLLEVGPGRALTTLARQNAKRPMRQVTITSMHPEHDASRDLESMLSAAGKLWTLGVDIGWTDLHAGGEGGERRRISLPGYPFEGRAHWVAPGALDTTSLVTPQPAHSSSETATAEDEMSTSSMPTSEIDPSLLQSLQALFSELSGIETESLSPEVGFLELGLDSLFLTQASGVIQKKFGVQVTMRELLDDCSTLNALARKLGPSLPKKATAPALRETPAATTTSASSVTLSNVVQSAHGAISAVDSGTLSSVLAQQLALMSRQLEMLAGVGQTASSALPIQAASDPVVSKPASISVPAQASSDRSTVAFGPYRPPSRGQTGGLTAKQEEYLHKLVELYNRRTAASKRFTQANRAHLADPRSVAGFRLAWKDLIYPIVTNRSSGAKLWDIDGNEYIDLTNGFGMIFFGHNPQFIREAVNAQFDAGIEIGPQTPLAGEVAQLVCEMVGMERAAFCATGSEAVTAAIRVARTVTGRDKIVTFNGAYHGIFDEVLVRPVNVGGQLRSMPIAPGIPSSMVDNVIVLDYGNPQSLQTIKELGPQLAAVLVEPVQSRRPDLQPREFLQELRKITAGSGTALVFDEVVTGFRVHPGGAQALFGIQADIATYGKVVGGGLPIGIVAGKARFLDALDGGSWRYGDDSMPEVGVTFFAGTFVRHPLALAAARAVLLRLRDEGPELQRRLNLRAQAFIDSLNQEAEALNAPLKVTNFASWFCFNFPHDVTLAPLFFASMRAKGVHLWEGRPAFITLAHTDADLQIVLKAFRETIVEMQAAEALPGGTDRLPVPGARKGRDASGNEAWFVPDPQRPGKYLQIDARGAANG